jgi:ABC-type lipoprotein release transport system permease subunit
MMALKMAFRNLIGAGLRTWLNVIVLSFSFVVIIWHKGVLDGWDREARTDMTNWDIAAGQYWHAQYDPYDPFTLTDSHAPLPAGAGSWVEKGELTPILITQGTLYPSGRMQTILVKGIDPSQKILVLPSAVLDSSDAAIPALIGSQMASHTRLKKGDVVTLRWRDKNGAFDAAEITIAGVFKTNVPTVDVSQIWIPLETLQKITLMPGEATILVRKTTNVPLLGGNWVYKSPEMLLDDINKIIKSKTASGSILWGMLLLMAMLAIFDTQVLSIFRRQKEIGTYVALGMTRWQVVGMFTTEGAMHSIFAAVLAAVYGAPLLWWQARAGFALPATSSDFGIAMAEKIYPYYSLKLVAGTVILIVITTTLVSFWPSSKISNMKPTDALRGKIQ